MLSLGFHVDMVYLLHQAQGIGIDLGLGFRSCGIAFKHIPCQMPPQSLGNLAAAGIVDTDKGYFFHSNLPVLYIVKWKFFDIYCGL